MTNIWNLEVGDTVTFTNNTGFKVVRKVTRIEDKSWYCPSRNSYGTLASYENSFSDFKITKSTTS